MRCKICGSIYSEDGNGCPMCCDNKEVIRHYHAGGMRFQQLGRRKDAHGHEINLGIELEVDSFPTITARQDAALEVFRKINRKSRQLVRIERDGSLSNGFEIITQPTQFWHFAFWKDFFEALDIVNAHGGKSHDSGNCGLHVHLDAYSESFVRNIWNLVNKVYRREMMAFSRRQFWIPSKVHYCDIDSNSYENRIIGHNCAVNTSTSTHRTVEIRIFRGTLSKETLIETMRLVTRLAWLALENDDVMTAKMPRFTSLLTKQGKAYFDKQWRKLNENLPE